MMRLKIFSENLAQVNSYLLIKNKDAILIDPGLNGQSLLTYLKNHEIELRAVLLTHGHFDHIKSIETLAKSYQFDLYVSQADLRLLHDDEKSYAKAFGSRFTLPDGIQVIEVKDEQQLKLLGETLKVIATPGHTKGSVSYLYQKQLFSGDTLFSDSIGRTDLFSASMTDMQRSLAKLVSMISNQVTVYPGHGPAAKMVEIKQNNPYL